MRRQQHHARHNSGLSEDYYTQLMQGMQSAKSPSQIKNKFDKMVTNEPELLVQEIDAVERLK